MLLGDLVLIKVTSSECPNGDEPEQNGKEAEALFIALRAHFGK
jgi:hypothetical protein